MSKFSNIKFPFYGLKNKPENIRYNNHNISINNQIIVDYGNFKGDYFTRLVRIRKTFPNNSITYDYTATNLQELIKSPIKWGLDARGKIFDLSKKEQFPIKCIKRKKIKDDLLWVRGVSYPFEIKYDLAATISDIMWIIIVNIDLTWYLYDFIYYYEKKDLIYL